MMETVSHIYECIYIYIYIYNVYIVYKVRPQVQDRNMCSLDLRRLVRGHTARNQPVPVPT